LKIEKIKDQKNVRRTDAYSRIFGRIEQWNDGILD